MSMVADRVLETSSHNFGATSPINLDGAVAGFQTFVAGIGTLNDCYYCITDNSNWEIGIGVVVSGSPDTLSRATILESSNGGSIVNFPNGSKNVFVVAPAAVFDVINFATAKTGDYTVTIADKGKIIPFNTILGDRTCNLPDITTVDDDYTITIFKQESSTNDVIIDPYSTQTIGGDSTYALSLKHDAVTLAKNGTIWRIIHGHRPRDASATPGLVLNNAVHLAKTTNQTLTDAVNTSITWNSQVSIDTNDFTHSTVTNNDRVYVDNDGTYLALWRVNFRTNANITLDFFNSVRVNGVGYTYNQIRRTVDNTQTNSRESCAGSAILEMSAGDYASLSQTIDTGDSSSPTVETGGTALSLIRLH